MKKFKLGLLIASAAAALTALAGCVSFQINSTYDNADKYSAGNKTFTEEITEIDLNWSSGKVYVSTHDENTVTVTEENTDKLEDSKKVHTWLDGKVLHIQFCKSGEVSVLRSTEKNLEVKLPKNVKLTSFKYNGSSAETSFENIDTDTFKADSSSGKLDIRGCTSKEYDLETSSGEIYLDSKNESDMVTAEASSGDIELILGTVKSLNVSTSSGEITVDAESVKDLDTDSSSGDKSIRIGSADTVKSDASSGKTKMTFGSMPTNTKIEASSGNVTIYVPKDASFRADIDTSSGKFSSEIPTSKEGSTYVAGSGSNKLTVDTSSGDVEIKAA